MPPRFSLLTFLRTQWLLLLAIAVVIAGFMFTWQFVEPPPPKTVTLAAGPVNGGYYYYAQEYAKMLAKDGVMVKILETKGSEENLRLLNDPASGVDVAFAQGGTGWFAGTYSYSPEESSIRSIGRIYEEALWVFTRSGNAFSRLRDLKGKRLAVGIPGSGAHALSVDLLKWNGINKDNTTFLDLAQDDAISSVLAGKADAAFFVGRPESAFLVRCSENPALRLHSFEDAEAYVRRFHYLGSVILPEGVLNFALDAPPSDIEMVAPTAALVTQEDMHPDIVYLFLKAAQTLNGGQSIFSDDGEFPNGQNLEYPLHSEAERYFTHGPSILQRFLPYHIAVFIDRTKILILPLLTLLIPLIKIAYPTYQWSIRRSIWKWYRTVRAIESDYYHGGTSKEELLKRLHDLEKRVAKVKVPFSYASELYTLRHHMILVRKMITEDK